MDLMEYIVVILIFLGLVWVFKPRSRVRQNRVPGPNDEQILEKKPALSELEVRQSIDGIQDAKVIWVVDGDTIDVFIDWRPVRIRLDSIDCPDDDQPWGDTAKYGLIKLIGGKYIKLEIHGFDHYGRTLATAYVPDKNGGDWLNVNERMVTLGHAWVMRKYYDHLPPDRKKKLNRLENWSRSKKIGLWGTVDPIPPWRWRNS
jgi:micrococcal nuclease